MDDKARILELEAMLKEWEDNVKYMLDSTPNAVRSCYKHGPENLIESLAITYIKLRDRL
jgi:hypothetical protein